MGRKRLVAFIMAIMLVLFMNVSPALLVHADSDYDIWVNGQAFSSSKTTITCGTGKATYDAASKILTLDNATITEGYKYGRPCNVLIGIPGVKIVLKGTNAFIGYSSDPSDECYSIASKNGCDILIDGDKGSSIDIKNADTGFYAYGENGYSGSGSVTIQGGVSINASVGSCGISAINNITIIDSSIQIYGYNYSDGINLMDGTLTIRNSTVDITADNNAISLPDSSGVTKKVLIQDSIVKLKVEGTHVTSDSVNQGYGIMIQPHWNDTPEGSTPDPINKNGVIIIGSSTVSINSPNGGTNLDLSKVTFGDGAEYIKGKSIKDSGEVVIKITGKVNDDGSGDGGSKADPTDPKKMGEDGTPYGKGASKAAVDKAITSLASENDPAGTVFGLLQLKVTKTTKNSVTVKWQKVAGAKTYMVYASNCGKKNKCVKVAELGSGKTTFTVNKKTLKKAIKKGTYYKVWVAALDKDDMVITTSKVVHGATKGGKVGDHKKVTTKAKKNKVSIKAKKTFKLRAKAVAKSKKLKVKKHRGIKYESSDPTVATVNPKGVIKGVKKGTCYVYAYAQNGVASKIKVTVK